jgi:calcineurin-like phosphoesterase family protein
MKSASPLEFSPAFARAAAVLAVAALAAGCKAAVPYGLSIDAPALPCDACGDGRGADTGGCAACTDDGAVASCGDGTCDPGESCASCPDDCSCAPAMVCAAGACTTCGNAVCDPGEGCDTCVADCACAPGMVCAAGACTTCGNLLCDPGEDCDSCADCACAPGEICGAGVCTTCGNGLCDMDENCASCASDCPCAPGQICVLGLCNPCGNGTCEEGEGCATCPADCACGAGFACTQDLCIGCGDYSCSASEDCATCPVDCGCPAGSVCSAGTCQGCGDGICQPGEDCGSCALDCACPNPQVCSGGTCTSCGNGLCEFTLGEDCATCPSDCGCPAAATCFAQNCVGGSCPNLTCNPGETPCSCPRDCAAPVCGDGCCSAGEDCGSCAADCGPCGVGGGGSDPVLAAAGDLCGVDGGCAVTAAILDSLFPPGTPPEAGRVAALGDNAYESGTSFEYATYYAPNWGRHKARTGPTPGNHDYKTSGAAGYFAYFGAAAGNPAEGWYAYDLGAWRIYVLNSNCDDISGCDVGTPQYGWLQADLDSSGATCQLATWHHARWSSGQEHGSSTAMADIWTLLSDRGAELVLVAHEHNYERFARLGAGGLPDPNGTREIVVGTGGHSHYGKFGPPLPGSEVRNGDTYGILKVTLRPDRYDWQFLPEAGKTFSDAGSTPCR